MAILVMFFSLQPSKLRQHSPLKCRLLSTSPHSDLTRKNIIRIDHKMLPSIWNLLLSDSSPILEAAFFHGLHLFPCLYSDHHHHFFFLFFCEGVLHGPIPAHLYKCYCSSISICFVVCLSVTCLVVYNAECIKKLFISFSS